MGLYGAVLVRAGKTDAGKKRLEAFAKTPGIQEFPLTHFFLALEELQLGNPDEARKWFAQGKK